MKANERLYIDFHILQTVPPSCINRDDTGAPKTAVYGGTTRARVSSQSWKRAVRKMFIEEMEASEVGIRTKYVHELLTKKIADMDPNVNAEDAAKKLLAAVGVKTGVPKKKDTTRQETEALFFISDAQLQKMAELGKEREWAVDEKKDKAAVQAALSASPALDMALFGRMVASNAALNIDAACQVAHGISTHTVHNEYDYFTAVDDCAPEDNAGAAHLDTVEYNSSTLYRYATINVPELFDSMGEQTAPSVRKFAEAFVRSMPTGKQNTFANGTQPAFVYVAVRKDQPINFAGAFEQPVAKGAEGGYLKPSIDALVRYSEKMYENFADAPEAAFVVSMVDLPDDFAQRMRSTAMYDALEECIRQKTAGEVM